MKIAILLIFASLSAFGNDLNLPHIWVLKSGNKVAGSYFTSGETSVVVKSSGTNCVLKIADLSTNDLIYFYDCKDAVRKSHLDMEASQMAASGMVEATASKIKNFPETVDGAGNERRCWMDGKFTGIDSEYISDPDMYLGFQIEDKNGDEFYYGRIDKEILGDGFMSGADSNDRQPNPLAHVALNLKHDDKIRITGKILTIYLAASGVFEVDGMELIQTATDAQAEAEARQSAASN
jgi:hypothetical protein